jgi:hypothetical protein
LQADGIVVRTDAPQGADQDRRAHWYAEAQMAVAAI